MPDVLAGAAALPPSSCGSELSLPAAACPKEALRAAPLLEKSTNLAEVLAVGAPASAAFTNVVAAAGESAATAPDPSPPAFGVAEPVLAPPFFVTLKTRSSVCFPLGVSARLSSCQSTVSTARVLLGASQ